ncbi:MAG: class I SAM-dependent methyltransferase [Verrucomicrobia bacterium]|nr:class I SAM-dependent methyltransferase [Verrucomicrobiota bacterium]
MNFTQRVTNVESPLSPSSNFRRKRIKLLMDLVGQVYRKQGFVTVIDVGGRRNYWNCVSREFLFRHQVTVTIVNLPGDLAVPAEDEIEFRYAEGNGCELSIFPDNSFDIAHSNSVIEHVGSWENMCSFAREIRRLAPNHYVQTPYFWFPIEPHFMKPCFHFLPRPLQAGLVRRFNLGHFVKATSVGDALRKIEGINLLDKKMLAELFPDASILREKVCGLTKSLIAYRQPP